MKIVNDNIYNNKIHVKICLSHFCKQYNFSELVNSKPLIAFITCNPYKYVTMYIYSDVRNKKDTNVTSKESEKQVKCENY